MLERANVENPPRRGKQRREARRRWRSGLGVVALMAVIWHPKSAPAQGSPAAGAVIFRTICRTCHTDVAGRNSIGPSLYGVFGRKAGQARAYSYSPAMLHSGLTWTEENLLTFLTSPAAKVPGTKMTFAGIPSAEQRHDIVAFLKTLGAAPGASAAQGGGQNSGAPAN